MPPTNVALLTPSPSVASLDDEPSPRISFRQPVSESGSLDAAWWPRSRDLTTEAPLLVDAMRTAGRDITRVTYNLRAWDLAPRLLPVRSGTVRLGGYNTSDPLMIRLSDTRGGERIDVLVVPPETEARVAQRALRLAAVEGSALTAAEVMTAASGTDDSAGPR